MRKTAICTAAFMLAAAASTSSVLCSSLSAQMNAMQGPATGSQVSPAKASASLLMMFEGECMGVAKTMPADKYNFSPAALNIPGAKFDGVRTFAEQVKHLAQANFFFASTVTGIKPGSEVGGIDKLTSKEDIVAALAKSFEALHKANESLTPENSFEVVPFEGGKSTRLEVASFAVAHGFDHYGQMVEYLRMNGLVPPGSK